MRLISNAHKFVFSLAAMANVLRVEGTKGLADVRTVNNISVQLLDERAAADTFNTAQFRCDVVALHVRLLADYIALYSNIEAFPEVSAYHFAFARTHTHTHARAICWTSAPPIRYVVM